MHCVRADGVLVFVRCVSTQQIPGRAHAGAGPPRLSIRTPPCNGRIGRKCILFASFGKGASMK